MVRRPLLGLSLLACGSASAAPISLNEAALARGFALPALGQAAIPEPGHLSHQLELDLVNEFFLGAGPSEFLEADGEATRLAWRGLYGIAPGWNVGVTIPFYLTGGGFLDATIESWHDFFSLPNANRADRPHNQARYRYVRNGDTLLDVHDSGGGVGEVRLEAGRAIGELMAIRVQIKLPTGDSDYLLGNDALGGAVWVDYPLPFDLGSRFEGFLSGGVSFTAEGNVLADQQKSVVPFGAAGLSCRLFGGLGASVQLGLHGALYEDSDLAPLRRMGAPLSFGANYKTPEGLEVEVLVQEDAGVYASPDFVLHFAVAIP